MPFTLSKDETLEGRQPVNGCPRSHMANRVRTILQELEDSFGFWRFVEFIRVCEDMVYRSRVYGKEGNSLENSE